MAESLYLECSATEIHHFTDSWRVFRACSDLNLNLFNGFCTLCFRKSNKLLIGILKYSHFIISIINSSFWYLVLVYMKSGFVQGNNTEDIHVGSVIVWLLPQCRSQFHKSWPRHIAWISPHCPQSATEKHSYLDSRIWQTSPFRSRVVRATVLYLFIPWSG